MQEQSLTQHEATETCNICMDSVPAQAIHAISGCFHHFCKECLEKYIVAHMTSKPLPIMCPAVQCGNVMSVDECSVLLCRTTDVEKLMKVRYPSLDLQMSVMSQLMQTSLACGLQNTSQAEYFLSLTCNCVYIWLSW